MRSYAPAHPLEDLGRRFGIPTLAEILWSVNGSVGGGGRQKHFTPAGITAWATADRLFGRRVDYVLYRFAVEINRPRPLVTPPANILEVADLGLEAPEPAVLWSVIAEVRPLLVGIRSKSFSKAALLSLVNRLDRTLHGSLSPVKGAEHGCAALRALALDTVQKARFDSHGVGHIRDTRKELEELTKAIADFDPLWKPGATLSFLALQVEREKGRRVVPFDDWILISRVTMALWNARGNVRETVTKRNVLDEQLLDQAMQIMFSCWRTNRAERRRLSRRSRLGTSLDRDYRGQFSYDEDEVLSNEFQSLLRTSQAARDAGNYLISAALGHLLMRSLPDRLVKHPRFRGLGDSLGYAVRQAGLEMDKRFLPFAPRRAGTLTSAAAASAAGAESTVGEPSAVAESTPGNDARSAPRKPDRAAGDPHSLRIASDREILPEWQVVLARFDGVADPLKRLEEAAESGALTEAVILSAGFELCLRYGKNAVAAKLLRRFTPTHEQLISFALAMRNALRIMPFGMDIKRHEEWQQLLREKWRAMPPAVQASPEALVIHEVLQGRYLSVLRNTGSEGAKLFALKYYQRLDDSAVRRAFDEAPIRGRGPSTARVSALVPALKSMHTGALGVPVCISLVWLGLDHWSLLGVGAGGLVVGASLQIPGVDHEVRNTGEYSRMWYHPIGSTGESLPIPWGPRMRELVGAVMSRARSLQPSLKWLALSVDWRLATLPWQDLVRRVGGEGIVVSLIPGLTWLTLSWQRGHCAPSGGVLKLSRAEDLCDLKRYIHDASGPLYTGGSAAVVLGHGVPDADGVRIQADSGELKLEDWLEIGDRSVVIVHSCFGGRVESYFLGDLGGLPGLVLGIGCRLFLAPVTEVPPASARVLHECLVDPSGPAEIGARYLQAVELDPAVSLYNLYGFANEPVPGFVRRTTSAVGMQTGST